jgi:hypothetical protein
MRVRGLVPAAVLALFLAALLASPALAAVSITRAELSGSKLRVEGQGATPNTRVTVNGDQASATSDGSGTFRIEHSNFAAPADCKIVVSDGTTSATATLSGCTPSSSPTPSGPAAPTPLGPSNGASVLVPFKISWSAVTDPTGIAGYNWQVSTTSSFSSLTQRDSTLGTVTEDTVGGLANGTYFWRVQAVNGDLVGNVELRRHRSGGGISRRTDALIGPRNLVPSVRVLRFQLDGGRGSVAVHLGMEPGLELPSRFDVKNRQH